MMLTISGSFSVAPDWYSSVGRLYSLITSSSLQVNRQVPSGDLGTRAKNKLLYSIDYGHLPFATSEKIIAFEFFP